MGTLLGQCVDRNLPVNVTVAAGRTDGESYHLANGLKTYLEDRYHNVRVELEPTAGTLMNLTQLGGGQVHIATAQADVALSAWLVDQSTPQAPEEPAKHEFGVIATLYADMFQLLACDPAAGPDARPPQTAEELFAELTSLPGHTRVYLPHAQIDAESGGQQRSFDDLASIFGMQREVHYTFLDDRWLHIPCTEDERKNLIFRVRAQGNRGVAEALDNGWHLVDLPTATTLWTSNLAREPAVLPAGAYRAGRNQPPFVAAPMADLQTSEVPRLLIAVDECGWTVVPWLERFVNPRCTIPQWLMYDIAHALNTDGPGLARSTNDPSVKRLFLGVAEENDLRGHEQLGLPRHTGVAAFYDPRLSWTFWFNTSAEGFSFVLAVVTTFVPLLFYLFGLARQWREEAREGLMEEATVLMTRSAEEMRPARNPAEQAILHDADDVYVHLVNSLPPSLGLDDTTHRVIVSPDIEDEAHIAALTTAAEQAQSMLGEVAELTDACIRLVRLGKLYQRAEDTLRSRLISESSFRTFNGVYATAHDSVEGDIERLRRNIAAYYVRRLTKVLRDGGDVADQAEALFQSFEPVLSHELVFSRDSFRTFLDAYGLALATRGADAPSA